MGFLSDITKPFKKILKSPLGKAALLAGLGYLGYTKMGPGTKFGSWFGGLKPWQQALTIGTGTSAAGALAGGVEDDDKPKIDTSGHEGYLNSRKMFVDEWTEWLMDQDDTLSYEDAHAQASDPLFNKAEGGLISLAQGGRIGLAQGYPGMLSSPQQQQQMQENVARHVRGSWLVQLYFTRSLSRSPFEQRNHTQR